MSHDLSFSAVSFWCDQKAKEYRMENYKLYFVDRAHNPVGFFINNVNITDGEYESAFVRWCSYGDTLYVHKHHILAFTHNGKLVLFAISNAPKEMVLKLSDEFYKKFECGQATILDGKNVSAQYKEKIKTNVAFTVPCIIFRRKPPSRSCWIP